IRDVDSAVNHLVQRHSNDSLREPVSGNAGAVRDVLPTKLLLPSGQRRRLPDVHRETNATGKLGLVVTVNSAGQNKGATNKRQRNAGNLLRSVWAVGVSHFGVSVLSRRITKAACGSWRRWPQGRNQERLPRSHRRGQASASAFPEPLAWYLAFPQAWQPSP